MGSDLSKSILHVCEVLNRHDVKYIIVGGAAVALHGYFRMSMNLWGEISEKPDLDFWYNPTYENYFNLLNALGDLGQNVQEFKDEQTPNPKKSFFKFETDDFTLDFLPELKAPLKFRQAFQNRETVTLNGIDIHFLGFDELIQDKEATARPKDINDIEQLRKKRNDIDS
jgi:hypothetical protein